MIVKTYVAIGGGISDDAAAEIGTYLESKFGDTLIDAERFVADAESKRSPLRKHLLWDDTVAAHEYRLHQARNVMNHIAVVFDDAEGNAQRTRAYHHVRTENADGYMREDLVWSDEMFREQILEKAWNALLGWELRYAQYQEFADIHVAIKKRRRRVAA